MARTLSTEVLIVGAGPVGLITALALAHRGVQVQIVDKSWRTASHSYALALHPATLRLLDEFGITAELLKAGRRIEKVVFRDLQDVQAEASLGALGGRYPYALVVPQSAIEGALEKALRAQKVKVLWNHEVSDLRDDPKTPTATVDRLEKVSSGYPIQRMEWVVEKSFDVRASYIVGADGYHSLVRTRMGLGLEVFGTPEKYEVFEFTAKGELPDQVSVVLSDHLGSVLWPMGEGRCRWSFQTDATGSRPGSLQRLAHWLDQRAPWFSLEPEELRWASTVQFEKRLAGKFGAGRFWLAGDAAHLTGPVGAQSMNMGMAEGVDLAGRLAMILRQGGAATQLEDYHTECTRAWRRLLGLSGETAASPQAHKWVRANRALIPACLPAAGEDLKRLLEQIGLTVG